MRKSDIRYPRATTDPRPAEGHTAAENIKCQVQANKQREGMWPTWQYGTRGCRCPQRYFMSIGQADQLTTLLRLFSLTASRAYWLPGMGRSIVWWVLKRAICFCNESDLLNISRISFMILNAGVIDYQLCRSKDSPSTSYSCIILLL